MRAHGSYARYKLGPDQEDTIGKGCRCDPCRQANHDYYKAAQRRVAPAYVGAEEARRHIAFLAAQGIGLKSVAKVSGVSHGALTKLVYGVDGPPSKRVRLETRDRILAVTPADGPDGTREPIAASLAVVEILLRRGWTKKSIGQRVHGPGALALQLPGDTITRKNARTLRALLHQEPPERFSRHGTPIALPEPEEQEDEGYSPPSDLPSFGTLVEEPWRQKAACSVTNAPTWIFYPSSRGDMKTVAAAKAVCATCSVRAECLDFALEHHEQGVWGGTSDRERRSMRRTRRASA